MDTKIIEAMEAQQASINALQVAVLEFSRTLGIVHQNHEGQAELARSERRILLDRLDELESAVAALQRRDQGQVRILHSRIEVLETIVSDLQRRDEGQREMIVKLLQMIQEDRGVMNIPIL